MLNPFPELLSFTVLAPTILRLIVGIIFISLANGLMGKNKKNVVTYFENAGLRPSGIIVSSLGIISLVGGILILLGLWTQISSIVLGVFTLGIIVMKKCDRKGFDGPMFYYVLLLFVLLSFILTGAGAFALDLPL